MAKITDMKSAYYSDSIKHLIKTTCRQLCNDYDDRIRAMGKTRFEVGELLRQESCVLFYTIMEKFEDLEDTHNIDARRYEYFNRYYKARLMDVLHEELDIHRYTPSGLKGETVNLPNGYSAPLELAETMSEYLDLPKDYVNKIRKYVNAPIGISFDIDESEEDKIARRSRNSRYDPEFNCNTPDFTEEIENREMIATLLDGVNDSYRKIIELEYLQELEPEKVCEMLNIDDANRRKRKSRAITAIKSTVTIVDKAS